MKVGLIVLVLLGVVLVEGKGPELVGSSVWYSSNATLLNTNFDLAVVQMVCFVKFICCLIFSCFGWMALICSYLQFFVFF